MATPDRPIGVSILLLDDDADIRRTLGNHLKDRGHRVQLAAGGAQALELLQQEVVDILITDVRMPGMDGFEVLRQVRGRWPEIEVIVVTAYGDVESAVRALREGAFDYFTKPLNIHDIAASLQRTARFHALRRENQRFQERLDRLETLGRQRYGLGAIMGQSPAIRQVKELIAQVSQTEATTVLVWGETGTGKELVARAIHYESRRSGGPLVAVDCTAVPQALVESEFYGHVKGAFTDAREDHRGYFELADGGTLFLDEVGDMALGMQGKLLRTLEERQVRRLGGAVAVPVDVRVVSATNQDLEQALAEGTFRADLYYRLNTFAIHLPPLRERPEDILPLAQHFLQHYARELRKPIEGFAPQAQALLGAHPFPGNIRELKNRVERAAILCHSGQVSPEDLDFGPRSTTAQSATAPGPGIEGAAPESLDLAATEKRLIDQALRVCRGNKVQAARLLGISRDALRRRLEQYPLEES